MEDAAVPGWYHAEGDPAGTERFWDGSSWTQGPRPIGGTGSTPPPSPAAPSTPPAASSDTPHSDLNWPAAQNSSPPPSLSSPAADGSGFPSAPPPAAPTPGFFAEASKADLALGLSIGGICLTLVGVCCFPIAIIGAAMAGVGAMFGHKEIEAIDSGRRNPQKRGIANAARIVGGIAVVVGVLAVVLGVVVFLA